MYVTICVCRKRRQRRNIERGRTRELRELEAWNNRRRLNAVKVNKDFDHRLRGAKSAAPPVEVPGDDAEGGKRKPVIPEYYNYEDAVHLKTKEWVRGVWWVLRGCIMCAMNIGEE